MVQGVLYLFGVYCTLALVVFRSKLADGREESAAITKYLLVHSTISARFAITDLMSEVHNNGNEGETVVFRANIPESAFISNFTMEVNGHLTVGAVLPLQVAHEVFTVVKDGAKVARYMNSMALSIKLPPRGVVKFNLTYQEILQRQNGLYRYIVDAQPDSSVKRTDISIAVSEFGRINSVQVPEFQPHLTKLSYKQIQELAGSRDAVVSPVSFDAHGSHVMVGASLRHDDNANEGAQLALLYNVEPDPSGNQIIMASGYFVHFFAPAGKPPDRHAIVFVLDKSGSMTKGNKFEQIRRGMRVILSEMTPADQFNLILFSHEVERWQPHLVAASERNKRLALDYLQQTTPDGNTNIFEALKVGHEILAESNADTFSSMMLLLTDAVATHGFEGRMIADGITQLNAKRHYAIHGLAYGDDSDLVLLKRISSRNRGVARHVYADADSAEQLREFVSQVKRPILKGIQVRYINDSLEVSGLVQVGLLNNLDYYHGGEVVTIGRLEKGKSGRQQTLSAVVTGEAAGEKHKRYRTGEYTTRRPRPHLGERTIDGFLERMWVQRTVQLLLDRREMADRRERERLTKQALELSMKYNLVTSVSAMIAVPPSEESGECRCQKRMLASEQLRPSFESVYRPIPLSARRIPDIPVPPIDCIHPNLNGSGSEILQFWTATVGAQEHRMNRDKKRCEEDVTTTRPTTTEPRTTTATTPGGPSVQDKSCLVVLLIESGASRRVGGKIRNLMALLASNRIRKAFVVVGIGRDNRLTVTHRQDQPISRRTLRNAVKRALNATSGGHATGNADFIAKLLPSKSQLRTQVVVLTTANGPSSVNRNSLADMMDELRERANRLTLVSFVEKVSGLFHLMEFADPNAVMKHSANYREIMKQVHC